MRTVFVSGAEGFAGSHLIEFLRQRGVDVAAGVRNRGRKLALERRVGKTLVCDVSDAINVARVMASVKPDGIVHLAGCSRPFAASCEPLEGYQSIVTGWANVLDAARRVVPRAKIVLVSAADVYGNAGAGGQPIDEGTPPAPCTTFGSLKCNAEAVARTFYDNYHLDISFARPFMHTGAGQTEHFFFGAIAQRISRVGAPGPAGDNGAKIKLPDLDFTRDLLHVSDVVEAYYALLTHGKPNEVYNICSGTARTCRHWIESMIAAANKPIRLTDLSSGGDGEQNIASLCGSNAKICAATGWKPSRRAEDALADVLRSFQAQHPPARRDPLYV